MMKRTSLLCWLATALLLPSVVSAFSSYTPPVVVDVCHQRKTTTRTIPKGPSMISSIQRRRKGHEPVTTTLALFYQEDRGDDRSQRLSIVEEQELLEQQFQQQRQETTTASIEWERSINEMLRASQKSFQHVESGTNRLLNRQPLIALAIFVGAGILVAYMMGMIFLGGYIETWNPAENDVVPYWDDPVLIIERKVGR